MQPDVMTAPAIGQTVRIDAPDNDRLHGRLGVVERLEPWGAVLRTGVGSGEYRALFGEMAPAPAAKPKSRAASRDAGYTGDSCGQCGSMRMRRNGACQVCEDCGTSSGCS